MLRSRIAIKGLFFINGFMQANLVSRFPRLMEMFSIDNKTLGVALFCVALGAVMAMPATGLLILRIGERKVTGLAIILYCSLFPVVPLMTGSTGIIVTFFIIGIVSGILNVCINAQAIRAEKDVGKPIMASFHALFSIGVFAGAACGSLFIKLEQSLFIHLLFLSLVSITAVFFAFPHLVDGKHSLQHGPLFRMPDSSLLSIGVIIFCCVIGESVMSEWSTNYMVKVVHATEVFAPWGLSAFALAMTIGRVFGDRARVKLKDTTILALCSMVAIAGILLAVLFTHAIVVMVGFFLVGLGLSLIVPIAYSLAGASEKIPPAVAVAMVGTVGYTGFLVGSPVFGFLADWHSMRFALGFIVLLFVVMAGLSKFSRTSPAG